MSQQFKGWLGITLGLLLVRAARGAMPPSEGLPALLEPLTLLAASLGWQVWGVWNMICHLCGWRKEKR